MRSGGVQDGRIALECDPGTRSTVLGRVGLTATLFLIGTGLSKKTLRKVGVKPLVQGVALWVIVASASLAAIYFGVISI